MGQDEGVQLCEFRNVKIGATAVLGFALLIVVSAATFMREESLPPNSSPEPGRFPSLRRRTCPELADKDRGLTRNGRNSTV